MANAFVLGDPDHPVDFLGFQQITSLAAAVGLTVPAAASVHAKGPRGAIITPTTQAVRFRADGTNPTASVGVRIVAGDTIVIWGKLQDLKFIEEAASAAINVQYLG